MSSIKERERGSGPSGDAGKRVLIVEDNADAAETMQLMLSISGYEARTAHDGASALEVARAFCPQVVLLDIGLPGKDGYQVAQELRSLPQMDAALLVALTGYGHEEDRRRAAAAGFDSFQVKPVDPQALEALLARHFSGRS
jgi:two-component system, chemotaxis family, CheB/CheR fusion protein